MNIKDTNQRQFEAMLQKEKRTVRFIDKPGTYDILALPNSTKNYQESLTIFYSQAYDICKGDIFELCGEYFILINRRNWDSGVFYCSTCIKCNAVWKIDGIEYPLVVGNLSSWDIKRGSIMSTVNGTISVYTKMGYMMSIDEKVRAFGGTYKCVNKYDIDGMSYYYFQREVDNFSAYTIKDINGQTAITMQVGQARQLITNTIGNGWLQDGKLTYRSSNNNIATVTSDGVVTAIGNGNCTITVEHKLTVDRNTVQKYTLDYSITVGNSEPTPEPNPEPTPDPKPEVKGYAKIESTADYIKIGDHRTLTGIVYDENDVEQAEEVGRWSYSWNDRNNGINDYILTKTVSSGINKLYIGLDSSYENIGTIITVKWVSKSGLTATYELEVIY